MKIVILGAGQVGSNTAEKLASEGNDITVVDTNTSLLEHLQDRLDIRTVTGHAAYPETLERAGLRGADLLVAVTQNDEVNMIACQVAKTLFQTKKRIARIRSTPYLQTRLGGENGIFSIDVIISPEKLVTDYLFDLISQPEVTESLAFFDGMAQLVAVRVDDKSEMSGKPVKHLLSILPEVSLRVAAIFRSDKLLPDAGNSMLLSNDEIFFLAKREDITPAIKVFRPDYQPYQQIIIGGGGNIGRQLAEKLQNNLSVKVIEQNPEQASQLAKDLPDCTVLQGDTGDAELLKNEHIEESDVFCAVTNDDEANILSAMLAKRMKARKVFSIISKASHVDLIRETKIDIAISPAQITIGSLLTHIRKGDVVMVHSLRQGAAEAMEIIAHGDKKTSRVVGRQISEIPLPESSTVAAILRDDDILFPAPQDRIDSGDHLVIFTANRKDVQAVEKLFHVDFPEKTD
ncbi:Trk system potassium uptake protein TrkA [Methylophaga frappieri]|uniref:Trk system potassium uptake protein TrkA n=1 Tax=Methylophaga frappieri (strain ATCC BAA-2434 / DSM 25690 / JAM7) TaxID=754477 RepID=I1YL96_METFJ|nr:Trk system potassium transporter TrkA [Methylophaga frappieri]AFJ03689.1 Trk system potassium uptake protein TrkA [Methylophaga frappieri]